MKTALWFMTVPFAITFLDGFFGWYLAEGFNTLLGASMIGGLIGAWVVEIKRSKQALSQNPSNVIL